jgi:hypothetical protein
MTTIDLHNQDVDYLCDNCEHGLIHLNDKMGFPYTEECGRCWKGHKDSVGLGETLELGDKLIEHDLGTFEIKEGYTSKDGNYCSWIAFNDLGEAFIIPALTPQGAKNNL